MGAFDLHAHIVLEEGFGVAGKYGPELAEDEHGVPFFRIGQYQMKPIRYRGSVFMDMDLRIERMEELGIERQMLSPNPLTMFHHIPAENALHFCRVHNDAMAKLVSNYPGRFYGTACLPMQDVDAACRELERATKELGLVGAYTGTHYPYNLDDAVLDPFYQTLVELDVPLFLHPASTGGDAGPEDPRLNRYSLTILLGYPYEEMLALATILFGGVFERHPDVDICISHGGGGLPYFVDRFTDMTRFGGWTPPSIQEHGFHHMLKKFWFDAHVDGDTAHELLVDVIGTDRLVYGTNFGGWESPHKAGDFENSLTPNAEKLLRLGGAA